jgi:hypothetical protein
MKRVHWSIIILLLLCISCSDGSSKFIGHWKSQDVKSQLTITRAGNLFTLEYYAPNGVHNIVHGKYVNGILKFVGTEVTISDQVLLIEGRRYSKWLR